MAGVTKHPQSRYFTGIFYDGAGLKRRRSTKQTDRRKALKIAMEWERLAKAGRERRLTEAQTRRVCSDILEETTGERLHFYSAEDWLREWLAGKKAAVLGETFNRYSQVLEDFLKHMGARAKLTIEGVTPKDIRSFRDSLIGGRAVGTVNSMVQAFLAPPFTAAWRQGFIQRDPCAGVDKIADDVDATRDVFTPEQIRALLQAASDEWRGMVLFGYYSGLRIGDIARLVWEQMNLAEGILIVTPKKTRKRKTVVVVPIHPELRAWLETRSRGVGLAPIFPELSKKQTGSNGGLSTAFAGVMAKAKIQGRIVRGADGVGRKISSLSFHCLRHSFVSALANAGVSPEIRKKLSGHTTDRSHAVYTHHSLDTLRDAMTKLPAIG